MSNDADLDSFVAVLDQQLTAVRGGAAVGSALDVGLVVSALEKVGALDLARDTAELENSLEWLSAVVSGCARHSASVAFALAARYVAERASVDSEASVAACMSVGDHESLRRGTVPTLLAPEAVVFLDRASSAAQIVQWDALGQLPAEGRTGLKDAGLRTVREPTGAPGLSLPADQAHAALFELDLLNASVMLGLIETAVAISEDYASNRRQFGRPVAAFAGLAAILVEMRLRSSAVRGLLGTALEDRRDSAEVIAFAGRACVDTCLDAIQVHGGYGYIDEYPAAGLLRDAISLRARGGGRRAAVAAVAAARLASV